MIPSPRQHRANVRNSPAGRESLDAFLDTCMLLGGMGPIHAPQSEAGKLFAGLFALYAGLVFIVTAALLLGPVVHRLLHHFHLERSRRGED